MRLCGWTSRRTTLRAGLFHSPAAGCGAPYRVIEERRWPTFLFVPLLFCRTRRVFVECQLTGSTYDESILEALSDEQLVELLPSSVRAVIAAVALADGPVTPEGCGVAIEVIQEFVPDYDVVDLECDLEDVGLVPLEQSLARLSRSLHVHGRERILSCAAKMMMVAGSPSRNTVETVRSVGRALGMSSAHVDGVMLHVGSAA